MQNLNIRGLNGKFKVDGELWSDASVTLNELLDALSNKYDNNLGVDSDASRSSNKGVSVDELSDLLEKSNKSVSNLVTNNIKNETDSLKVELDRVKKEMAILRNTTSNRAVAAVAEEAPCNKYIGEQMYYDDQGYVIAAAEQQRPYAPSTYRPPSGFGPPAAPGGNVRSPSRPYGGGPYVPPQARPYGQQWQRPYPPVAPSQWTANMHAPYSSQAQAPPGSCFDCHGNHRVADCPYAAQFAQFRRSLQNEDLQSRNAGTVAVRPTGALAEEDFGHGN